MMRKKLWSLLYERCVQNLCILNVYDFWKLVNCILTKLYRKLACALKDLKILFIFANAKSQVHPLLLRKIE